MNKKIYIINSIVLSMLLLSACAGNDHDDDADSANVAAQTLDVPGVDVRLQPIERIGSLAQMFNDSNSYQYAHAERLGIRPIECLSDAYHTSRPIRRIESCKFYEVDKLTHSMPYLVPEAARLLEDVGRNFIDSIDKKDAKGYKIMVTSLLRTPATVKQLRRVNVNATDSSTHKFGTTFDISYVRFSENNPNKTMTQEQLKLTLADVLFDLRNGHRCLVKYERKTGCFHVTVVN